MAEASSKHHNWSIMGAKQSLSLTPAGNLCSSCSAAASERGEQQTDKSGSASIPAAGRSQLLELKEPLQTAARSAADPAGLMQLLLSLLSSVPFLPALVSLSLKAPAPVCVTCAAAAFQGFEKCQELFVDRAGGC